MYTRVESRELRRCVVRIDTVDGLLCGTGFFVAPGWVLTCAHVVKDQPAVSVVPDAGICDGPLRGTVEARSAPKGAGALWPFPDLALIRLDTELDHPCVLLDANDPLGEQECRTWGYPPREHGLDPPGSPAGFRFEGVEGDGYLRLKAGQAKPGLSGAPLLCPARRAVVGVVSASRNIDTDLGGWASPVSALFDGGPGVPLELVALGRRIRHLNRAAVLADRTAWHRVLPVEGSGAALEQPWAPFARGPRSSPADLLRTDFGVVPYLFRDMELRAMDAWCAEERPMAVVQVAARGGAGKTRFGLEVAARLAERGWVSGLWDHEAGHATLAELPVPRFVVIDYVEWVDTQKLRRLLEALRTSATDLAPVRVLLLTRTGTGPSADPLILLGEDASAALKTILDKATDGADAAGHLTLGRRHTLFTAAVAAFTHAWSAQDRPMPSPDLGDARYALPLEVLFEAFDHVLRGDAGPDAPDLPPVERVLRHEQRYWSATAPALPWLDDTLRRRFVAAATLAGAADVTQAHALIAAAAPERAGTHAERLPVTAWLAGLYDGPGHLTPLRPDRLGESLVAAVLRDDPHGTLLDGVLGLSADGQVVHALDVIERLGTADSGINATVAHVFAVRLPALADRAGDAARGTQDRTADLSLLHGLLRLLTAGLLERVSTAARHTAGHRLPELAAACLRLGDLARASGRGEEAGRLYHQSAALGRDLTRAAPENAAYRRDLGVAYNRLGDTSRARGDLNEAAGRHQQATAIAEELVLRTPASSLYRRDLAVCYDRLGELARLDERWPDAERLYRKALATARKLARAEPVDAAYQRDLLIAYNRLGDLLSDTERPRQAAEMYEHAVMIGAELARRAPHSTVHLRDLAVSYNRLGDLAREKGGLDAAAAHFRHSLEIREELARAEPGSATCRRDLGLCYARLGDIAHAARDGGEAVRLYRKSWELAYTLVRGEPDNAAYQKDLTAVRKRLAAELRDMSEAAEREESDDGALRWNDLVELLREVFDADLEGAALDGDVQDVPFVELGIDSLALLQVTGQICRETGASVNDEDLFDAETPRNLLALFNTAPGLRRRARRSPRQDPHRKAGRPMAASAVRSWVVDWLTGNLGLTPAQIDLEGTFTACVGFDSIKALDLLDDIEIVHGIYFAFDTGWNELTVRTFARELHSDLVRRQKDAARGQS
ncbi:MULTISPECIES: tetratricopeptide repeat protein [unclassified Streptomyces]|uniref:tetratricopeptide repeat protein n=1 Tax=unclassified Streptomyces TaxID=2593676 RepID=UPI0032D5989D